LRIAFFGLPLGALLLARDGHDVALACICRRDALGLRRLRSALGARVLVAPRADDPALLARLRAASADLLVSWFWTTRLGGDVLASTPLGAFGVHPSILPRHRGPDPYFWAIERGDEVTGVTAHRLDEAYDTGAILAQAELRIDPRWNAWQLAKRLDRPSLALLRETARRFARGEAIGARVQDEALATRADAPTDGELEIDWGRPRAAILRRIRAASPWPGAFTFIADAPLVVTAAAEADAPKALRKGELWIERNGPVARVVVKASDGGIALLSGRAETEETGGNEVELPDPAAVAAYIAQHAPPEGAAHVRPKK